MAAGKPEVIITLKWLEIFMKFQRWNPCFRGRWIQWSYFWYCPTLITNRKWKMALSRPEVVLTMQWNKISVKFERWNPCFLGRRIQWSHCWYCLTLITNRKWKWTSTTGSSYHYAMLWVICDIPTSKLMFWESPNATGSLAILSGNCKYLEIKWDFQGPETEVVRPMPWNGQFVRFLFLRQQPCFGVCQMYWHWRWW